MSDDPKKKPRKLKADIGIAARDATQLSPTHNPPHVDPLNVIASAFLTPFYERMGETGKGVADKVISGVSGAWPQVGPLAELIVKEAGPVDIPDLVTAGIGAATGYMAHRILARNALEQASRYGHTLRRPGRSIFPGPRPKGLLPPAQGPIPAALDPTNIAAPSQHAEMLRDVFRALDEQGLNYTYTPGSNQSSTIDDLIPQQTEDYLRGYDRYDAYRDLSDSYDKGEISFEDMLDQLEELGAHTPEGQDEIVAELFIRDEVPKLDATQILPVTDPVSNPAGGKYLSDLLDRGLINEEQYAHYYQRWLKAIRRNPNLR